MPVDLLVIGSGSLAQALCHSLAVCADQPVAVAVLARNRVAVDQLTCLATTRAVAAERPVTFTGSSAELSDGDQLDEILHVTAPRVVVQCASLQSPWEGRSAPSRWTELVAAVGLGVTLPLQARLVVETARAIRRSAPDALLVNACFPDAVNPLLHRLGLPVFCGLGNIATLAASLRAALGCAPGAQLRLLAHHVHLHAPRDPHDEARAWLDDAEVSGVGDLLAAQRRAERASLNQVTGYVAARFLADLLAGRDIATNLPGPSGRPGGYPVRVTGGRLTLDLPPGLTEQDATRFNERAAGADGIRIGPDRVEFVGTAAVPGIVGRLLSEGFIIQDVIAAAEELAELRSRLRLP